MAKSHALVRHHAPAPRVIVMAPPRRGGRVRRAGARVASVARRVHHRAKAHYAPTSMILGAFAVGYARQKGAFDKLPAVMGSKVLTLGLVGFAATRFSRNATVRMAGSVAMLIAAADFGRTQAGGAAGEEGDDGPLGGGEDGQY